MGPLLLLNLNMIGDTMPSLNYISGVFARMLVVAP